ncbi:helix-turn-helix domain-containing protein [Cnuibacter physcomitrellae]|uniref:PucR family transcriptional regulator n=1 Tax=Cnuibacter physcomitrellae TaxID=1619308 RepID=UPI00217577B9|nr:helix-turn-helix domain-containing protein [Cnuibacter physcomitrellae]MCS5495857.1 helix-turn-helix domain-containing protein [Cnuibacter physcomitrellae]
MEPQSTRYEPSIDLLTARAVDLMWNTYEGYSDDVFDKRELIPSVAGNIDLGVRVLQRGTPPRPEELTSAQHLGGRRAGQGVPLESVIQAYRSTERTLLLDLFSGSQAWPVELTSHYADLVITTFDLLTEEMINSYRETASALEAAQRRVENELVLAIASGPAPSGSDLDHWAQVLGVEQSGPWIAFAIGSAGDADHTEVLRLRQRIAKALQGSVWQPLLFGDVGRSTLALARPRVAADEIRETLHQVLEDFGSTVKWAVGVGGVSPDLVGAHESCQEARDAVAVAMSGDRTSRVVPFDDVLVEVLLAREPKLAARLVESRLGALEGHPYLIDTLEALVACDHSQAAVAKALFVHPNTVTYRIRRIQQLTGFDPLVMSDFTQMALALLWLRGGRA